VAQKPRHWLLSVRKVPNVWQGSVATHLRWTFSDTFITNVLLSLRVKEFWSLEIGQYLAKLGTNDDGTFLFCSAQWQGMLCHPLALHSENQYSKQNSKINNVSYLVIQSVNAFSTLKMHMHICTQLHSNLSPLSYLFLYYW